MLLIVAADNAKLSPSRAAHEDTDIRAKEAEKGDAGLESIQISWSPCRLKEIVTDSDGGEHQGQTKEEDAANEEEGDQFLCSAAMSVRIPGQKNKRNVLLTLEVNPRVRAWTTTKMLQATISTVAIQKTIVRTVITRK